MERGTQEVGSKGQTREIPEEVPKRVKVGKGWRIEVLGDRRWNPRVSERGSREGIRTGY